MEQNRRLIHLVRWRGFRKFFSDSTKFSRKNVRCKLRGFQIGKSFPRRSRYQFDPGGTVFLDNRIAFSGNKLSVIAEPKDAP